MQRCEAFYVKDTAGKEYRIFTDGSVEGFDSPVIVNRIPMLIGRAFGDGVAHTLKQMES